MDYSFGFLGVGGLFVLSFFAITFSKNKRIRKLCGIPFYYKLVYKDVKKAPRFSLDINGRYTLVGAPDAIFKHFLLKRYRIVEMKSREIRNGYAKKRELYQVTMYIEMVRQKFGARGQYKGYLAYRNGYKEVSENKGVFKWLTQEKGIDLQRCG